MQFTAKTILDTMKRLGYPVYKGDFNLNLVGIRSHDTDANTFNDVLVVLFELDKKQMLFSFPFTTDPGIYYREHPINSDGTAVLVPGHYRSCWKIGSHRGQYRALVQVGEMNVHRDNDHDALLDDLEVSQAGVFGINLHHAGASIVSMLVDKWSAGCQVIADPVDFELLMALVKKSAQRYGDRLSYTLLTEDQL